MAARSVSTFACQYNDFSSQRKMLENCLASARVEGFARISGAPIAATWAAAEAAAAGSTFLPVFLFVFPYIPVYFPPPAHPHFPQQRLSVLHCIWAEISGGIAPEGGHNEIESVSRLMGFWFCSNSWMERVDEGLLHSDWKLISHFPINWKISKFWLDAGKIKLYSMNWGTHRLFLYHLKL